MTWFWSILALLAPWLAGTMTLRALRERWLLSVAAGWLLGQAMMFSVVYISLITTGASHARLVLAALLLVAAMIGSISRIRPRTACVPTSLATAQPRPLALMLLLIVGLSLTAKLCILTGAHALVPARANDAISIWLFKAKVLATLDRLPLDPADPYYMAGSNPRYPIFPPLIAAWIPLVTGHWNERLATLPWLFFYLNLILLIAAGLRRWQTTPEAWLAAYVVGSLPLLIIHVYRPGYADLPLACFLAGTVLYLLLWQSSGRVAHLLLAMVFAAATACMKREGPTVAAVAVLAGLATGWRKWVAWPPVLRWSSAAATALIAIAVAWASDMTDVRDDVSTLVYHPEVWPALRRHLLDWSSFSLLFWTIAATAVLLLCTDRTPFRGFSLLLTTGLLALGSAIFLLTTNARFATNDQTPSRIFLQFAPALVIAWAVPLAAAYHRPCEGEADVKI